MNTRILAIKALDKIDRGSYSNLTLDNMLKGVKDKRDRALITAIVYGVLRYRKKIDYILTQIANRPPEKIDRYVLHALRIALYQVDYLDRIPERAAVNESIEAVKGKINRGAVGFINGVMRNYLRNKDKITWPDRKKQPVTYIANFHSHPEWVVKKWLRRYGFSATVALCIKNNKTPGLRIRCNSLKYNEDEFISILKREGIVVKRSGIPYSFIVKDFDNIENMPLYKKGGFFVQGSAATLAGYILNPLPGMNILDMTAGPGGKTTHIAELMQNKGEIIAIDKYSHKIKLIKQNCRRLGINIVKTIKADAVDFNTSQLFDKILLDVPCSGLGVIAQKPELKWRITEEDINKLNILQKDLLARSVKLLKPEGEVLYCTCTLLEEENQQIISDFLDKQDNRYHLVSLKNDLQNTVPIDLLKKNKNFLELFPTESNTEGFFMAKIKVN